MSDPRIEAIRNDKVIGRGTCTLIDECFEDQELIEYLDEQGIKDPDKAVNFCRRVEMFNAESALDARWGEDSDPQVARYEELKGKLDV